MATREKVYVGIAAVLTTLAENPDDRVPASMMYMALDMDITVWEIVRDVLVKAGWVKYSGHAVSITPAGCIKAAEINAAMK